MNCMAFRYPSRVPFNKLKMETYLFLDSVTPSTAFAKLAVNQGEKTQKWWLNTYVIVCEKKKDALNITLSNSINFTNVHLCNQKRTFTVIPRPVLRCIAL